VDRSFIRSAFLWAVSSSLLLAVGFVLIVYVASILAARRMDPDEVGGVQRALAIYAQVVLLKGLLPQLLLTLVVFAALDRVLSLAGRGHWIVVLGLVFSATVAVSIVFPMSLTVEGAGLPAVKSESWASTIRTCAEMTAAVVAAATAPLLVQRLRDRTPSVLAEGA
jgi:hypothetical protein